jgi:3-(3-hydroxy-phenyl)propionate hydroxylase
MASRTTGSGYSVVSWRVRLLSRIPRLRRLFENLEIKPANRFASGCFVQPSADSRLRRGGQVPQCLLRSRVDGRTLPSDDAIGPGFALLGFGVDPSAGLPEELVQAWHSAGGTFVQIDPRGRPTCPSRAGRWEDVTGALMPSIVPVGWIAIVRPDRTVMHDGPAAAAATMLRESLELFVETVHGTQAEATPAHRAA